jgi:hypothetical protein
MRDFRAKFREVPGGELLWERLDQTTCGREFILMLLQVHCGAQVESSERKRIKSYLALRKRLARRLDRLAKRFKDITKEIARVALEVPEAVSVRHSAPLTLPAQVLATASKQLRGLSLKTVPMYTLCQIAWYMKAVNNFNYEDLALLLKIGYKAFGPRKDLTPSELSHLVRRAMRRIPDWAKVPGQALLWPRELP